MGFRMGLRLPAAPIALPLPDVIKRFHEACKRAACPHRPGHCPASRALRLEPETNPSAEPQPVVDIEDDSHVLSPICLSSREPCNWIPTTRNRRGRRILRSVPGQDYLLLIPRSFSFRGWGWQAALAFYLTFLKRGERSRRNAAHSAPRRTSINARLM